MVVGGVCLGRGVGMGGVCVVKGGGMGGVCLGKGRRRRMGRGLWGGSWSLDRGGWGGVLGRF